MKLFSHILYLITALTVFFVYATGAQSGELSLALRCKQDLRGLDPSAELAKLERFSHHPERRLRGAFDWPQLLKNYVRPALDSESDLLVLGLFGPGGSGKSTLMNSIPFLLGRSGEHYLPNGISMTSLSSGNTRRLVMALTPARLESTEELESLQRRFGILERWLNSSDATTAGPVLLYSLKELPKNIAIVDSPDFNTAAENLNTNQNNLATAQNLLRNFEVLVYIFSPFTYNDLSTARFLREAFQNVGNRRVVLVYRVNPGARREEMIPHFKFVAQTFYPESPINPSTGLPSQVLGAYIFPESAHVASGARPAELIPIEGFPSFSQLIEELNQNADTLKAKIFSEVVQKITDEAERDYQAIENARQADARAVESLNRVLLEAAEASLGPFDFETIRNEVREFWHAQFPYPIRVFRNLSWGFAHPVELLKRGIFYLMQLKAPFALPAQRLPPRNAVEDSVRSATTQLTLELSSPNRMPQGVRRRDDVDLNAIQNDIAVLSERAHRDAQLQLPMLLREAAQISLIKKYSVGAVIPLVAALIDLYALNRLIFRSNSIFINFWGVFWWPIDRLFIVFAAHLLTRPLWKSVQEKEDEFAKAAISNWFRKNYVPQLRDLLAKRILEGYPPMSDTIWRPDELKKAAEAIARLSRIFKSSSHSSGSSSGVSSSFGIDTSSE